MFRCNVDSPMYAVGVVVTTPGGFATRRRPQLRGGVMAAADLTDWNCVTFYCTQLSSSSSNHAPIIAKKKGEKKKGYICRYVYIYMCVCVYVCVCICVRVYI